MNNKAGCLSVIIFFLFIAIILAVLTMWTDRTFDFWCSYIGNHTVDVPYWLSFLASLIGNGLTLMLNIISEIARLIMGV